MRRVAKAAFVVFAMLPLLAAGAGELLGSGILHPARRLLTPELIAQADDMFKRVGATREEFDVRAPDGVLLRGWKVRSPARNGDWVLLFHGVSDNRTGMLGHSEFLLRSGYGVVMMDARSHGASEGAMATYGWKERHDTRAIVDALYIREEVHIPKLLAFRLKSSDADLGSKRLQLNKGGGVTPFPLRDLD